MNKLARFASWCAVLSLFCMHGQAAIIGAPYLPEQDLRYDVLESSTAESGKSANNFVSHHAKAIFSVSASGAATSTGISLPAKAIIKQAYWFTSASGTPPSGTTLAFQCDAANDVYTATDISAIQANAITAGAETGTAATMHYSSAGCDVKYVLAVHNPATTATYNLFIDYVVAK